MDFQRAIFPSTIVDHFYRTDIYVRLPYKTNMITILSFTSIWRASARRCSLTSQHSIITSQDTAIIRKFEFSKLRGERMFFGTPTRLTNTPFGVGGTSLFSLHLPICIY